MLSFLKNIIFKINDKKTRPYYLFIDKWGDFYTVGYEKDFFNVSNEYDIFSVQIVRKCKQKTTGKWIVTSNKKIYENISKFKEDGYKSI